TVWFDEAVGFFDQVLWHGDRRGPGQRLDLPTDIRLHPEGGWVAVARRSPWHIDGETHAPDTVLGIALADLLAGDHRFAVLFVPGPRRALQHFFWSRGRLVLSILDQLQPVFEVVTPSAGGWRESRPV